MGWFKRFNSRFALDDNPEWIGVSNSQVEQFLTELAVDSRAAASTQKQAFSAFLYVFRNVLQRDLQGIDALRAKRPKTLPIVLEVDEVCSVLDLCSLTFNLCPLRIGRFALI